LVGLALVLIAMDVTLIANYSFNREERLNYLLGLRGEILVKALHHSNERLADVAEQMLSLNLPTAPVSGLYLSSFGTTHCKIKPRFRSSWSTWITSSRRMIITAIFTATGFETYRLLGSRSAPKGKW
jgi:hypothetical protein